MITTNIDNLLNQVDLTPDSLQDDSIIAEPVSKIAPVETDKTDETDNSKENSNTNPEEVNKEEPKDIKDVDDYGQPVNKKERVYTESEVQQMMRDRNARGEFARQEAERARQEQLRSQEHQNEESDNWEHQLESFVEQTLSKREQKLQEQQWQQQQAQQQAEFEIKFNTGAAKYADFEQVVVGKSLTPQMVIATRGMNDPAAFIYAAAKTQSTELDRISKINDPYAQAVELGKLEERMRRGRTSSSAAPKPISTIKGDAPEKSVRPKNVDDILREEDARRRKG